MSARWIAGTILSPIMCVLGGCNYYTPQPFSTLAAAQKLAITVESAPVFSPQEIPPKMPSSVPIGRIDGDFYSENQEGQALLLKQYALEIGWNPDWMVFEAKGSAYAGSVSNYIGYGISISRPVMRPQGTATCFRITPATLGIRSDRETGFVRYLTDEARASGIQEGDSLLSIDGFSVVPETQGAVPPSSTRWLQIVPGEECQIVWIRPGTGRMEGTVVAQPNRPMPEFAESMDKRAEERRKKWQADYGDDY